MLAIARQQNDTGVPSVWHFGSWAWWAWWLWATFPQSLPGLHQGVDIIRVGRIVQLSAFALVFLVMTLLLRRLSPLRLQKTLFACVLLVASLGTVLTGLTTLGLVAEQMRIVGCAFVGAAAAPLLLLWIELFGVIGSRLASISIPGSALLGAGLYFALSAIGDRTPFLMIALLVGTPWVSYAWLTRSWRDTPTAKLVCPVLQMPHLRVMSIVLSGVLVYGVACGLMLNLAASLSASPSGPAQVAGVAAAALLILVEAVVSPRTMDLGLRYRPVLPLTVAGFLLLPMLAHPYANIASALAMAGHIYFTLLMLVVLAEIAPRIPASALTINGWGLCLSNIGVASGMLIHYSITSWTTLDTVRLSMMSLAVVGLLILANTLLLNERSVASLWGLMGPQAQEPFTPSIEEACSSLAAHHGLTPREQQVLILLAKSRNAEHIRKELTLSISTVRTHTARIYAKLNVHSHQELVDLVHKYEHLQ